jgi:hypothetical protein
MFLYQTHQRPKIGKYHLRQNSLQLKTTQERKGTRPVDRSRRQTRLLGDVTTSTADITIFKILINITLSTEDAVMMMMYIKNYYIRTPLTNSFSTI